MRNILDDYLDGAMEAGERAALERQIAADPIAAQQLAAMKQERALRAAAYASFEPSQAEAHELASSMMNTLAGHKPAGYVGVWVRRTLGVAAALGIVVGSFAMGRMTGTPETKIVQQQVTKTETQVVYRVVYFGDDGAKEVREFAGLDEANDFVNKLDAPRAEARIAAVDLSSPGSF
jgi:anti-sigma factor RsiW